MTFFVLPLLSWAFGILIGVFLAEKEKVYPPPWLVPAAIVASFIVGMIYDHVFHPGRLL